MPGEWCYRLAVPVKRAVIVGVMVVLPLFWIAILMGSGASADTVPQTPGPPYRNTYFDADPSHPWNRLYGMLFIRPALDGKLYGLNEIDPLYWPDSHYLLDAPLHRKVLGMLDDFIKSDSAALVKEPLKRALLQRMLWALFDSLASQEGDAYHKELRPERRELQERLVKIMKRVALTDPEIKALPDNYQLEVAAKTYPAEFDPGHDTQPFLPGTFFSGSEWVDLVNGPDGPPGPLAPAHVAGVSGRSAFHVLISLPTGQSDTLAYLKKLNRFEPHWIYPPDENGLPAEETEVLASINPKLPQVPPLTKFALVRTANLIDAQGEPVNSPLTESVQLRVILTGPEESFGFFVLDQMKLMRGEGGLVARQRQQRFEMVLNRFMELFGDSLEPRWNAGTTAPGVEAPLSSCLQCHGRTGILSMNSYIQLFGRATVAPPDLEEGEKAGPDSVNWKEQQYDWGQLRAYWFE